MLKIILDKVELAKKKVMRLANPVYGICVVCNSEFRTKKSHLERRKTCSKQCDTERRKSMYLGSNNPNFGNKGPKNSLFKTGERLTRYGYKMIYKPEHPNSQYDGYILEHRYVMASHLGRTLEEWEHVHHLDGNKLNNDIVNLQIISASDHSRLHNKQKEIVRDSLGRIKSIILKSEEK